MSEPAVFDIFELPHRLEALLDDRETLAIEVVGVDIPSEGVKSQRLPDDRAFANAKNAEASAVKAHPGVTLAD